MGGGGVRLSRLAMGHRACAARSGLYCLAPLLHPRPPRGMGFGCAAMRKRAVTYVGTGTTLANSTQRRGGGSPLGGRTGHFPALGQRRAKRLAHNGWAGANTTDSAKRLTRTLCGFGAADTALTNGYWAWGAWLRLAEPWATRAGQGAQDITGVACSGATSRALAAAWGHATCDSPLC